MKTKVSLDTLQALSYNPRLITDIELERLKASIKEHTKAIPKKTRGEGYRLTTTVTVNVNGNRIVGGHQRIKALKSLGQDWIHVKDITWVDVKPDSSKEKSLNITLNSERYGGFWNQPKLDELLRGIKIDDEALYEKLDLPYIELEKVNVDVAEMLPQKEPEKSGKDEPEGKPEFNLEPIFEDGPALEEPLEETDGKAVVPSDMPQLYPLSYAVTAEQRQKILAAIKKAKETYSAKTSADALTIVCERFNDAP